MNGDENVYKEILSVPELAARQLVNSNTTLNCRLVTQNLYTIGAAVLNIGETRNANATRSPETATSPITYESLDTSIATVDENGNITAVGNGKTKVLAKSAGVVSEISVYIEEAAYRLDSNNASTSSGVGTFTADGYEWETNGYFYKTTWYNDLPCVSGYNKLWNKSALANISAIVISEYVYEVLSGGSIYDVQVNAGGDKDNLQQIYDNANVSTTGSGEYSGDHEYGLRTYFYVIPEGCSYFSICFNGTRNIKSIEFFN